MKMRKVLHGAQASRPHFLRLLTLCAFFAAGIIAGQLIGPPLLKDGGSELTEYLQSYAGVASELTAEPLSLLRVLAAYFRVPLLLLLLGFCTFADQDEIQPTPLTPWIGFVYIFPEARGKRLSGLLLAEAARLAREMGAPCTAAIFIPSPPQRYKDLPLSPRPAHWKAYSA